MKFIDIIVYKADKEDIEIVKRCIDSILFPNGPKPNITKKIYDISNYKLQIANNHIVIAFGQVAYNNTISFITENNINAYVIQLAPPKLLIKKPENRIYREEARDKLSKLIPVVNCDTDLDIKSFNTNNIPDLDKEHILLLNKLSKSKSSFQITRDGSLIEISTDGNFYSDADIKITIEELYAIRSIIDIFKPEIIEVKKRSD